VPNYKGHLLGGIILYSGVILVGALYSTSLCCLAEWLLCTLLGSLFPDIDTKSKGQKIVYCGLFVAALVLLFLQKFVILAYLGFAALVPLITNHRGLFHKLWFLVLLMFFMSGGMLMVYPHHYYRICTDSGFFLIGIISHLWLDFGFVRMLRL